MGNLPERASRIGTPNGKKAHKAIDGELKRPEVMRVGVLNHFDKREGWEHRHRGEPKHKRMERMAGEDQSEYYAACKKQDQRERRHSVNAREYKWEQSCRSGRKLQDDHRQANRSEPQPDGSR